MRPSAFLLACLLALGSCLKESDYDIQSINASPTMAFPIAFGDLGLVDLLSSQDSGFVRVYPDGLLYLYYSKPLNSTSIRDHFDLPDNLNTVQFDLPAGTLPANSSDVAFGSVNRLIDFSLSPERLTEVLLKLGDFGHAVSLSNPTSPNGLPLQATITLEDVLHKTTQQPLVVTLGNGSASTSLADYVIHMNDNQFGVRVDLVIKAHVATFIPAGTKANVQLNFLNMTFGYIKGFLGDQTIALPPHSIDVSAFKSSLKNSTVSFVAPTLNMKAINDYGVPCEVNFTTLRAGKGPSTFNIQTSPANPITLLSPPTLGAAATTNLSVTNQQAVVNFGPERLEYSANVRINKGLASGLNFLADTSKLRIYLDTEIPLYGKVSGISVADTLDVDFGNVDKLKIAESSLKVSSRNELPLDAYIQIFMLDSAHEVIDSVFSTNQTYIVKASTVDAAGDLAEVGASESQVILSEERLSQLLKSRYLIIRANMNTARDENDALLNVKFRAAYRLKLNIGLLARLNLTVK